jgi:hypothetical protein
MGLLQLLRCAMCILFQLVFINKTEPRDSKLEADLSQRFFLLTGTLHLYFIISFCIQYLCVNLGHRSLRVHDVLGDLRRMISLVVGSYFGMPPLLLPGLEPASPGTPIVLTRVNCLSLKTDHG